MRHGVVLVGVRDDGQHRAEDLLARDAHGVVGVGEQRGPDVPAAVDAVGQVGAADDEARAFALPGLDVAPHPFLLALGDERPDLVSWRRPGRRRP